MRLDLYEFETVPGGGDGGGDPAPEPTPEPAPEPEAAEPFSISREEWQQTQAQIAQAAELAQYIQQTQYQQEPQYEYEQGQQPQPLPEYDPFDPASAQAYFDARFQQMQESQAQMLQQALGPVLDRTMNEQALEWQHNTFSQMGVPDDDHWQRGVLFASAGFAQDEYGRPVPPEIAASRGMALLQEFAQAERAAAVEEYKQQQEAGTAALRERAGAPHIPTGPAGGEGQQEFNSMEEAHRAVVEKMAAQSG